MSTPLLVSRSCRSSRANRWASRVTKKLGFEDAATGAEKGWTPRQAVEHWHQHGFGFWIFHAKSDGQFIGRGGLKKYQIDQGEVIGLRHRFYRLVATEWLRTQRATSSPTGVP
jgi:hypothetical protein